MYELLRTKPAEEASEILRRVRGGLDPEVVLRHVEAGDLLLQVSLVPETRYRYVFPFIKDDIPEFPQLPENKYLESPRYENTSPGSSPSQRTNRDLSASEDYAMYFKPYHAAEVVDPLVSSSKPSAWTTISKDDRKLRRLLQSYLICSYFWFTSFNKEYFLQDMSTGIQDCCSSLLVNSVFALACV
jgi:hypothetical protein